MKTLGSILLALFASVLSLALSELIVIETGVLMVGIPPVWAAWCLLAAGLAFWAWFLMRTGWLGRREGSANRALPLLLLAVVALAITAMARTAWNRRINLMVVEMKAAGLPTTLSDMARNVPKARNAGPAMEAWYASYTRTRAGEPARFLDDSVKGISDARVEVSGNGILIENGKESNHDCRLPANAGAVIGAVATKYARLFRAVEKELSPILDRYDAREVVDYRAAEESLLTPSPSYSQWVNVCRIYSLVAYRRVAAGDLAGAWKYVGYQVRLANLIAQDHSLIAKMISVANAGIAARTASVILMNRPGAVIPAPLAKEMAALMTARWIQEGIASEVAYNLHARAWIRKHGGWTPPPDFWGSRTEFIARRKLDYMGVMDAIRHAVGRNIALPLVRLQAWTPELSGDEPPPYPQWIRSLFPWFGEPRYYQLVLKQFEFKTRIRFALLASAVHAYKARSGRFPAKLADLGTQDVDKDLLTDFFTGKEYGYKTTKAGFEISSEGPWGKGYDSKSQVPAYREPPTGTPPSARPVK